MIKAWRTREEIQGRVPTKGKAIYKENTETFEINWLQLLQWQTE